MLLLLGMIYTHTHTHIYIYEHWCVLRLYVSWMWTSHFNGFSFVVHMAFVIAYFLTWYQKHGYVHDKEWDLQLKMRV